MNDFYYSFQPISKLFRNPIYIQPQKKSNMPEILTVDSQSFDALVDAGLINTFAHMAGRLKIQNHYLN